MKIPKSVMHLSALNKSYAMLEAQLAKGIFIYERWHELADQFPEGSKRQREIRKRAAKIEKERHSPCGHPIEAITSSKEGTSYCAECEKEATVNG